MRKQALATLLLALSACGSDAPPDPASRKFQYGTAQPAAGSVALAADAGEAATSSAITLHAATATDPGAAGSSMVGLPDAMAGEAWGSATLALQSSPLGRTLATLGGPAAVTATGFDDPGCVTVQPALITYSACRITLSPTDAITVSGTIGRSGPTVSWSLDTSFTMATTGATADVAVHLTGGLTFGAGTVKGQARSDTRVGVVYGAMQSRVAYTTLADLDLTFSGTPACVDGGTLELRRVWTDRGGAPATGQYADQGLLFTWQGCGTALVASSL